MASSSIRRAATSRKTAATRKATPPPDDAAVRSYLAGVPRKAKPALERLRALVCAAAPGAVESRSYGILGYKLDGKAFVYCAGWAEHLSLYPVTPAMTRAYAADVSRFQTSKGTLRFPLDQPLPVAAIKRLLRARIAEMRAAKPAR